MKNRVRCAWIASLAAAAAIATLTAGRAAAIPFTYQGQLDENGVPAQGQVDLRIEIHTDDVSGVKLATAYADDVTLTPEGRFSVEVGFEQLFSGAERWLAVAVRPGSVPNSDRTEGSYTALQGRQQVTAAPYAFHAFEAEGLDLPIDETANILGAPSLRISNSETIAIHGHSINGIGLKAESGTGAALYAVSASNGWSGHFEGGPVYVHNRLAINYANATSLKIACNGDAAKPGGGSWSVLSDRAFKTNIRPLEGALDRLLGLHGVTFEYTDEARERGLALPGTQTGFIAQDVETVFPDWVGRDEDGTRYVTERGATALMVEALRELRQEKDAQIRALQEEMSRLRARLDAVEHAAP